MTKKTLRTVLASIAGLGVLILFFYILSQIKLLQFDLASVTPAKTIQPNELTGIPVSNAGADQNITLPTNSVTVDGSASTDSDGTIVGYLWTQTAGGAVTIATPTTAQTVISGFTTPGTYTFRLRVTDDSDAKDSNTVNIVVGAAAQAGCAASGVIFQPTTNQSNNDGPGYSHNFKDNILNGNHYSDLGGATIIIDPSIKSYFTVIDLHGSSDCPVTITNPSGQTAKLINGMAIIDSTYVHITGTNGGTTYGVEIAYTTDANHDGFADRSGNSVSIQSHSAHIEADHIYMHDKTYGFWIKNEASCDNTLNYPNWWIDDIKIHDNKIYAMNQEGMYIGSTSPTGQREIDCSGVKSTPIPSRLSNILIYNNDISYTQRAGIQISGADSGTNKIYGNTVLNNGYEKNSTQGPNIWLGGETSAEVYNNTAKNSYLQNIISYGIGTVNIHDNVVDGAGTLPASSLWSTTNSAITDPQVSSIFSDTRGTNPHVSTTIIIKNNQTGTNTTIVGQTGGIHKVGVTNSAGSYATSGNIICNNGVAYVASGINYSNSCAGGNNSPVASAGLDQTITLPVSTATLSGSGSDSDGTIASYAWTKISGGSATIVSATASSTLITGLTEGSYTFRLTVKDNQNATGTDDVIVTVNPLVVTNAPPTITLTSPANGSSFTTPTTITISASAADSDGTISKVDFYRGSTLLGSDSTSPYTYAWVNPVAGSYGLTAKATDNLGATKTSSGVTITVNNSVGTNIFPTVTITAPANDTTFSNTNAITISATAADSDGSIAKVEFYDGTTKLGEVASAPYNFSWSTVSTGSHLLTAVATDNKGAITTSSAVSLTVSISNSSGGSHGGGGGGGGGSSSSSSGGGNTSSPQIGCTVGALFSATTGLPCTQGALTGPVTGCKPGFLFSSVTGAPCPPSVQNTETVASLILNLRASPVTGTIITTLKKGDTVTVLEKQTVASSLASNQWAHVTTATGLTGWVYDPYLTSSLVSLAPISNSQTVTVTVPTLNVRSTPNGTIVGHVTSGATGSIITGSLSSSLWVKVQFTNGLTGYVYRPYVK